MEYGLFNFLQLIGSLGIFIFGMKIFSEGLQKVAGNRLRSILKGMTRNRLTGVITGFGATTITQSSSATTVMVVSFVNAGLMSFIESTGVIMGANIGTTVTAWIVSIFGFKMKITPIAISLIGLFFPFMFSSRDRLRNMAEAMIGFGILFIGLEFLKDSVPNIQANPELFEFLNGFTDFGIFSVILFVLVGTTLTLLTQSSSAAMAITLVMLFEGWIPFPIAASMILGENIGTTVTANLAAIVANVDAKRSARFHLVFNLIGVVWMIIVLNPFIAGVDYIMSVFSPGVGSILSGDALARENATLGLSLFHSAFNIINVLLLFGFVPSLIRLIERFQKEGEDEDQQHRLRYISSGLMTSSELSITQAHKEIELFAQLIEKMHDSFTGLFFKKPKKREKLLKRIAKREQITDNIELEVAEYLTRVSGFNLTESSRRRIRAMHSMINDLERIGDLYFQMSKTFEQGHSEGIDLPEEAAQEIGELMDVVLESIRFVRANLANGSRVIDLEKAQEMERKINKLRDQLKDAHYKRLEEGSYSTKAGFMYLDYLNRLEKIGDHLMNVNEALAGRKLKAASRAISDE